MYKRLLINISYELCISDYISTYYIYISIMYKRLLINISYELCISDYISTYYIYINYVYAITYQHII